MQYAPGVAGKSACKHSKQLREGLRFICEDNRQLRQRAQLLCENSRQWRALWERIETKASVIQDMLEKNRTPAATHRELEPVHQAYKEP